MSSAISLLEGMFLLDTGDRRQSPLRFENRCRVILCYIKFCLELHPWLSACGGTECLSITGARDKASVIFHGSVVPAARAKLLLSSIFYYTIVPFYYSFEAALTISDILIISHCVFNASSQFTFSCLSHVTGRMTVVLCSAMSFLFFLIPAGFWGSISVLWSCLLFLHQCFIRRLAGLEIYQERESNKLNNFPYLGTR